MSNRYREAGVDITLGDSLSTYFAKEGKRVTHENDSGTGPLPGVDIWGAGGFGGLFRLPKGYTDPILVSGTDGVGTKVLLANDTQTAYYIGQDLVCMSVNDIITTGAKPLYFLDYMAAHSLEMSDAILKDIFMGVAYACRCARIPIIGGETAELRLMYRPGEFDLAGFAVGIVEEDDLLDPKTMITPGMSLVGVASSGIHSNGFSLVHHILNGQGINPTSWWRDHQNPDHPWKNWSRFATLREVLCQPTGNYAQVTKVVHDYEMFKHVFGMAHITGGGLFGNIERILPDDCDATLNRNWQDYPLWEWLQRKGGLDTAEMFRTFNMGIGFVIVVPNDEIAEEMVYTIDAYASYKAWNIGKVVARNEDYQDRVRLAPS